MKMADDWAGLSAQLGKMQQAWYVAARSYWGVFDQNSDTATIIAEDGSSRQVPSWRAVVNGVAPTRQTVRSFFDPSSDTATIIGDDGSTRQVPSFRAIANGTDALQRRVLGAVRELFVPGDMDTFYPVGVRPLGTGEGYTMRIRVSRPALHRDQTWLGSYSADVWARLSCWGNAPGEVFSVMQRSGNGKYPWGLGRVEPQGLTPWLVIWLRGGMTHTLQLLDTIAEIDVLMPAADGRLLTYQNAEGVSESWSALKGDVAQPLYTALNFDFRPRVPMMCLLSTTQYTRATLPAAGSFPAGIAFITDGPSGPTHVFSNGQRWRVPTMTDL
ncbi:hypothetical protein ACUXVY_21960 [Chromobacterium haemolyticum]|uniref:hypothetical protein n=1 Tax=Chromobacterium haemolyticum TaxID=394935 RepID=UPI004055CF7D